MIKVLVGDDDKGLAAALADTVSSAGDMDLVAVRHDADAVVNAAAVYRPDVILMDVRMPGGGVSATRRVLAQQADVAVVGLSAHEDQATATQMVEAGAVAYLVKGMPEEEILDGIRRAARGQMSMPAELGVSTVRDLAAKQRERTSSEATLRATEEGVHRLLDAMPDALLIVNARHAITAANAATQRMFGYAPGELLGQRVDVLVPERFRKAHARMVDGFHQHARTRPMGSGIRLFGRRKDGSELPVDISLSRLDGQGERSVVAAIRDMTDHQDAYEVRRKSERLFRGMIESAPDAMLAVDARGRIHYVNSRAEDLFGYLRDELLAMTVEQLVPQSLRAGHAAHRARYLRDPQVRPMGQGLELFGRRRDGSEFPIDISLSPMATDDGMLVIAAVRDVTDRKVAERRLAETQEAAERRRLMTHLVQAQEEERRKIAADIHDDSIQAMTAASLRLQQLRKHITTQQQQELIARLDEAVRESITRLRRLMFDLRPPTLDRTGLGPALRELLERLRAETDIEYTFDDRLIGDISRDVRIELYRIAQEALTNVRKHSGAAHVELSLQQVDSGCRVRIADDGEGFEVTSRPGEPGHIGLMAMRERAGIGGGWLTVDSRPGHGTVVEFWMPDAAGQAVSAETPLPGSVEAPR